MKGRLLLLVGLFCVLLNLHAASAQDRSRSRYIAPADNEEEELRETPPPPPRRVASQRTRTATVSSRDEEEKAIPQRQRGRTSPPVEESYELRQPSPIQSYHQPALETAAPTVEDPPTDDQHGRRRRPKKRRRPKAERKQKDAIEITEEKKEDKSSLIEDKEEYFAHRDSRLPPETSPHKAINVESSRHDARGPVTRNDRIPNRDIEGDRRTGSRYIDDSNESRRDQLPVTNERTSSHQTYYPQPASNRLPVENDDIRPKFGAAGNEYSREQPHLNRELHNSPQAGYPAGQTGGPYREEYASIENGASRLPTEEQHFDRQTFPESREQHNPAEGEVRLPPTESPHIIPIYGQDERQYQAEPKSTSDEKAELNSGYPVPTNRLSEPVDVNYSPQANREDFSHSNDDSESVRLDLYGPQRGSIVDTNRRSLPLQEAPIDRQAETESRHASPSTRAGSRYLVDDDERIHSRSSDEDIEARPPDTRQRTNTRQNVRGRPQKEESAEPVRSRTDARLQRAGSRYQSDDSDSVRYNPSRATSQDRVVREPQVPPPPPPARVSTRPQRTRTRYQADEPTPEAVDLPERTQSRRVPVPVTRTVPTRQPEPQVASNQYNYPLNIQQAPPQRQPEVAQPPARAIPSRSRQQPQHVPTPVIDESEHESEDDQVFRRSRPQYSGPNEFSDDSATQQPEYQRTPPRRNEQRPPPPPVQPVEPEQRPRQRPPPPPVQPVEPEQRPRQRPPSRQQSRAPVQSRPSSPPRPSPSKPSPPRRSSSGDFECVDPYGFYGDERQCDKYYECRNGTAHEGLCSDGLVFNPISSPTYLRCDSLRDIDCSSRPELQTAQPTKNCPRRYGLYPDKKDCTKFWHCVDGVSTQVKCPPGLVYDDSKGTCNWADLVEESCSTEDLLGFSCPEATRAELQEGVYTRYPHPDNCQLHFTCIKGSDGQRRPRMLSCNEGYVFDPETAQCTRPEDVAGCEEFYGKPVPRAPKQSTRAQELPPEEEEELPPSRSQRRRKPTNQRSRS